MIQRPPPFDEEAFGHAIAAARRATGMTLDEFADRSGLARRYLTDLENARKVPSIRTVSAIAYALRIPLDRLLRDADTFKSSTPIVVRRIVRVLDQERTALADEVGRYRGAPQQGSAYLADDDRHRQVSPPARAVQRQQLWHEVLAFADAAAGRTLDHLHATQRLLEAPDTIPRTAHVSLVRAACEAAAAVFHVLEPRIEAEQRLLRGAMLLLDETAVRVDTIRVLPVAPQVAEAGLIDATDRIESLQELIYGAGVTVVASDPAWLRFTDGGPEIPRQVDVGRLVGLAFPGRPDLHQSAAVALYGDAAGIIADGAAHDHRHRTLDETVLGIAAVVDAGIAAGDAVSAAYSAYYGHNPGPAAESRATRSTRLRSLTARWSARPQTADEPRPA